MSVKLHVAIPNYGGQIFTQFEACRAACEREGLIHSMSYVSDSLVSRARNVLTQKFLDSAATHLLFIDADIVFQPDDMRAMIKALETGKQIVGGLYALKQRAPVWVLNALPDEKSDDAGMLKVSTIGTGFLAIERSVFYRMSAEFPEIRYHTDENEGINQTNGGQLRMLHDFFSVGVVNGRYLSEDWYFCHRARQLGYTVWANTNIKLGHIGAMIYPIVPDSETGKPQ